MIRNCKNLLCKFKNSASSSLCTIKQISINLGVAIPNRSREIGTIQSLKLSNTERRKEIVSDEKRPLLIIDNAR